MSVEMIMKDGVLMVHFSAKSVFFSAKFNSCQTLASQWKMIVLRYRIDSYGRFAVAGPSTWGSLPDSLRDPALRLSIFQASPEDTLFCQILTRHTQRIEELMRKCYYKCTPYLLTYLTKGLVGTCWRRGWSVYHEVWSSTVRGLRSWVNEEVFI